MKIKVVKIGTNKEVMYTLSGTRQEIEDYLLILMGLHKAVGPIDFDFGMM